MSDNKPPEQSPAADKTSAGNKTSAGDKTSAGAETPGRGKGEASGPGKKADSARTKPAPHGKNMVPAPPARGGSAEESGSSGTGRAAPLLAFLALLVSVGTAVAGYFIWHELGRLDRIQQSTTSRTDSTLSDLRSSLEGQQQKQTRQLNALRVRQDTIDAGVAALRAQLARTSEGWVLANVQYLLQVANESLALQRNVAAAEAALQDADQRLAALGDPGYLPVRRLIATELTALKAVPKPDVEGIAVTLDSLIHEVPRLTLRGTALAAPVVAAPGTSSSAGVQWRQLPTVVWHALRQLVQVRHHGKPVGPLLAPSEAYFLYQNLKLQLETAQLAALRRQPGTYRASLGTAEQWLHEYFSAADALTKSMSQQLEKLRSVDVRPPLPDLSGSLRKLRELRTSLQKQGERGTPAAAGADSHVSAKVPPASVRHDKRSGPIRPQPAAGAQ